MRSVVNLRWECECGEGMQVNVLALYFCRYLCGNILSIEEDQSHANGINISRHGYCFHNVLSISFSCDVLYYFI